MNGNSAKSQEKLGGLSREKTRLFELLLDKGARKTPAIERCPREWAGGEVLLPTSWAQRRLWFIDQLEGVGAAYNEIVAVKLQGKLNVQALQDALHALVARHEILRTTFVSEEGMPKQRIAVAGSWPLQVVDLSGYPQTQRAAHVHSQKVDEGRLPFDLQTGPLIRARLLREDEELHVLIITMHHIVSDGWSMGVLIREFSRLYSAYVGGGSDCGLQSLPIQYADYAQWQREWLQGEVYRKQLSHWRAHLQGAAPELELPTDRSRPAAFRYRGANVPFILDQRLGTELRSLAQRHALTLFMVLYAGWAILLSRLSGQNDVVIGTPVANRRRPELEGLIGFFVSTLPLRVNVPGDATLSDFLQQVRETTLRAYDNQDIPFEQIVEALRPERSLSRHPIFQVAFALQSVPPDAWHLSGLTATDEEVDNETAKFDLTFLLEEQGEKIVGSLNYDTDLFERQTMERWIACFHVLLRSMTADATSGSVSCRSCLSESGARFLSNSTQRELNSRTRS